MKRYFLLFPMAISFHMLVAQAVATNQPIEATEPTGVKLTPDFQPPTVVSARFATDYPNVKAAWSQDEDSDIYNAQYRDDITNMGRIVRYDNNGMVISVDNELHNDAYPASIGTYYIRHYPGEKYAIWSREDAAGNRVYYANRNTDKVWFDKDGKAMQQARPAKKKSQKGMRSSVAEVGDNSF